MVSTGKVQSQKISISHLNVTKDAIPKFGPSDRAPYRWSVTNLWRPRYVYLTVPIVSVLHRLKCRYCSRLQFMMLLFPRREFRSWLKNYLFFLKKGGRGITLPVISLFLLYNLLAGGSRSSLPDRKIVPEVNLSPQREWRQSHNYTGAWGLSGWGYKRVHSSGSTFTFFAISNHLKVACI